MGTKLRYERTIPVRYDNLYGTELRHDMFKGTELRNYFRTIPYCQPCIQVRLCSGVLGGGHTVGIRSGHGGKGLGRTW